MSGLTEKLEWINLSLEYLIPEAILVFGILLLVIISAVERWSESSAATVFALLMTVATGVASCIVWLDTDSTVSLFVGMVRLSPLANYLKLLIDLAAVFTIMMSWSATLRHKPEYFVLIATAVLGAHLMVMSTNFAMLFLSIELVSLPSYLLVAWGFERRNMEAALKYFLFGSVASAIMLYGISLLYGLTHTLDFTSDAFNTALYHSASPFLIISVCLVLSGLLFKLSSAPFHPWAPDVYEAAPMPVVAFLSVVPKLGGLGILATLFFTFQTDGQPIRWHILLTLIVILTILVGNFGALWQRTPKRLMAYSSIAQTGFLMLGLVTGTSYGLQTMLFYATAFLFANFLVFNSLAFFETKGITTVAGFAGMGRQHVTLSILLFLALISLTGLPPTAGFMAKLFVFSSIWTSYENSGDILYLVVFVVGLINTVVAVFYYLKIPYQAFLQNPVQNSLSQRTWSENLFDLFLVIVLLALFFLPNSLMGWLISVTFV